MHLGRFHYVTWLITEHFEESSLLANLDGTIAQLQSYVSSPTSERSKAFRTEVDALLESCALMPAGSNTASVKKLIEDSGGSKYFGSGLENSLREIIEQQSMTPADMLANLNKFRKNLADYATSMSEIADRLGSLGVEFEALQENEFEFGATFPKELVGVTIVEIQAELEHIDRLFKSINEIMGKGSTSPVVRNISSSWWQFFLNLDYLQISAIALAIERIVALYKSNLEIQKLKRDAETNNLGTEIVELINKKIEEKLKSGMLEIAHDIRKQFQNNKDNERCNELETQMRMELVHLALRINQGAAYEVSAGLPIKPKALSEEQGEEGLAVENYNKSIAAFEEAEKKAIKINNSGNLISSAIEEISVGMPLLTDYAKLSKTIQDQPAANIKK